MAYIEEVDYSRPDYHHIRLTVCVSVDYLQDGVNENNTDKLAN